MEINDIWTIKESIFNGKYIKNPLESADDIDPCPSCGSKNLAIHNVWQYVFNVPKPIQHGTAICKDCEGAEEIEPWFEVVLDNDTNKWMKREHYFQKSRWRDLDKATE